MTKSTDEINYDLAKIWLAQQDLTNCTPEQIKNKFFDQLRKLEQANGERWD